MVSFLSCAALKPEGEFWQIVNSRTETSVSETTTRSGLSVVEEMFGGIVAGGLVLANFPGRAANRRWPSSSKLSIERTSWFSTESCRQVNLPWSEPRPCNATSSSLKGWGVCQHQLAKGRTGKTSDNPIPDSTARFQSHDVLELGLDREGG